MAFKKLFSPIKIRDLELKNRIVMAGMGTHMGSGDGAREVGDRLIDFHVARAKGGVGLITVEVASVDPASSPANFLSISSDQYIYGYQRLNDAIHKAGGKTCIQLWQGSICVGGDPAAEKLVPSDRPGVDGRVIHGMSESRIQSVIEAYGLAAKRAVNAGFDCLEFHCAHNYLPHSFLSGGINHRSDVWGGNLTNQMKFPLACLEAIRAHMPSGMPLLMRIGCHDDYLENGLTMADMILFGKAAKEKGVDVLNISRGNVISDARIYEVPPVDLPNGFNVEDAAHIRRETGLLTMPAGRINTPQLAEQILNEDKADMVVMARAQLADAEFCNKSKAGLLSSIKYCIACDQGCYDYFVDPTKEHITCLRNPAVGEESELALIKSSQSKKVVIAGGGIGGLEAADYLYKRGHQPILCEAGNHLGGQLLLAGAAPRKSDTAMATEMAARNILDLGIDVRLNTLVTPALITAEKPAAVIIATGSRPLVPRFPGSESDYVYDSHYVLRGNPLPLGKIVVIGGGLVGLEVAEYLCAKGSAITVVEMKEAAATDLGGMRKIAITTALAQENITILVNTKCMEICNHQVIVEADGAPATLEADAVIMAIGCKPVPSDDLKEACELENIPCHIIGDALQAPRRALNAIHEAYAAALSI